MKLALVLALASAALAQKHKQPTRADEVRDLEARQVVPYDAAILVPDMTSPFVRGLGYAFQDADRAPKLTVDGEAGYELTIKLNESPFPEVVPSKYTVDITRRRDRQLIQTCEVDLKHVADCVVDLARKIEIVPKPIKPVLRTSCAGDEACELMQDVRVRIQRIDRSRPYGK